MKANGKKHNGLRTWWLLHRHVLAGKTYFMFTILELEALGIKVPVEVFES